MPEQPTRTPDAARSFRNCLIVGFLYAGILALGGWEIAQSNGLTHYGGLVAVTCLGLGFIGRVARG